MEDRKNYLLKTDAEIKDYTRRMQQSKVTLNYLSTVCKLLDSMIPGKTIEINRIVKPENIEMFIKSVCLYMDAWPSLKIEFTNDLTGLIKRK